MSVEALGGRSAGVPEQTLRWSLLLSVVTFFGPFWQWPGAGELVGEGGPAMRLARRGDWS